MRTVGGDGEPFTARHLDLRGEDSPFEVDETRAAERLGTSPAAVSRTLARLRRAVGDPLLVRAGQGMVPTPRALELREEVGALLLSCDNVLRPEPVSTPCTSSAPSPCRPPTCSWWGWPAP
ncbi:MULTISPECIES: LysR family transcriptional regulator [Kitasatospora]|uniref:HTH lysR-type domain-containing protein n=1 Tax=Kitasatospora cystarginea TaxID=58350 RepID=A0ABP5QPY4_9ACTN